MVVCELLGDPEIRRPWAPVFFIGVSLVFFLGVEKDVRNLFGLFWSAIDWGWDWGSFLELIRASQVLSGSSMLAEIHFDTQNAFP